MKVQTRSGVIQKVDYYQILEKLTIKSKQLEFKNDSEKEEFEKQLFDIVFKIINEMYDGITTEEIDEISSRKCVQFSSSNLLFDKLAVLIEIDKLHKRTDESLLNVTLELEFGKNGIRFLNKQYVEIIKQYHEILQNEIDFRRDSIFNYFGFKTLEKAYLLKKDDKCKERPQHLWMRVSVFLSISDNDNTLDIDNAISTYHLLSKGIYTHATPTLFNAGLVYSQLSSCFLLGTQDSVDSIFKTISDCALISKYSGGIGIHLSNIRGKDSLISSTNGKSNGIIPLIKCFEATANFINQGGKRKGSIAVYLEPWHCDIIPFLNLRKEIGEEKERARDIFTALFIPDLFMKRLINGGMWSLMCPNECVGLTDVYGNEFEQLYIKYENEGKFVMQIPAIELEKYILQSQQETGTPYICFKDHINKKSNQKNIGIIRSSNLCCEIMQYSDANQYGVCNLASINLASFVNQSDKSYDFESLINISKKIVKNLNKCIDKNYYPTIETKYSNFQHRPIGVGVQGLADTFFKLNLSWEDKEASILNRRIFACIYYGGLLGSIELAKDHGFYTSYPSSPTSKGILQYDLWNITQPETINGLLDWNDLKLQMKQYGLRNSLITAVMPTASTSQILGNYECIEPITSNIFTRNTLAGNFIVINKYLIDDLNKLGLWNDEMKDKIIFNKGSVQNIEEIPSNIKRKYKTIWELKQKIIIDMAIDRSPYICQSQSMNIYLDDPSKLYKCHIYAWEHGLKTGCYYFKTKPASDPTPFSLGDKFISSSSKCKNDEVCTFCSA